MNDILFGMAILGLLSGCLFRCGQVVSRHARSWLAGGLAAVAFVSTLVFSTTLHGRLILTRILPFSNAVVVGNWIPLGAAVLMGIVHTQASIPKWRRVAVSTMLASLAWYTVAYDLLAPAPRAGRPRYSEGVCVQTTPATCSVCCAVTLLMHHGIQADEGEMIGLCLTRMNGTPELGLYRGIKLKTRETPWDAHVVFGDVDELKKPGHCPAVLLVVTGDDGQRPNGPRWLFDNPNHAVIVYGFDERGVPHIGNPICGRSSRWTADDLRRRWRGAAICLAPRKYR